MNYRMIKYVIGWILLFETLFLLVPTVTGLAYMEKATFSFLITMAVCAVCGGLLVLRKPADTKLYAREGFVIVSLSWVVLSLFGALPFMISGATSSYIDALFETVSGFTTTGASIFGSVEDLPRCILMWRSFSHWVGGMGVLVFIMAFIPLSGAQNMFIMKAESPGPSVSKLVPRIKTTALILYSIYGIMTVGLFVLLLCGGMSLFDAVNTAFATAGTGGFSVRNNGMLGYSAYLQIVTAVFMVLFSINFNSFYLLSKRKIKEAFNAEVRCFLVIVLVAVTVITLNTRHLFGSLGEGIRHVFFTVASLISTTGFATVDFDIWPQLSRALVLLIMAIGACAGSTGGGIKVSRIMILCKGVTKEIRMMLHPKQVKKISMDGRPVEHEVVRSVNAYIVCYLLLFIISVVAISVDNHDLVTGFSSVLASLNNIGPGLNMVGPTQNFGFFSDTSKLVLIFDMLAGRLELFPMLLLFSPATWRKH